MRCFTTECGLTSHAHCTHLVPDFCGMSMEAANQILETLIRAKVHNKSPSVSSTSRLSDRTLRAPQTPQDHTSMAYPSKPVEQYEPARPAARDAVSAASMSYKPPQSPTTPQASQTSPRTSASADLASHAAAAAANTRPPQAMPGMFISQGEDQLLGGN